MKLKIGSNLEDDVRHCAIVREEIGPDRQFMIDANQVWSVPDAIEWMSHLAVFNPLWIEEPTNCDDILGHAAIAKAVAPIKVATGETAQNRILFKQLFQAGACSICQIDACRVGSVNEVVGILLLASKFGVPVCPHNGMVGLSELVVHLAAFDCIAVSGEHKDRVIEYVDYLHDPFVEPVVVERARYRLPETPGYAMMTQAALDQYRYPDGSAWVETRSP